MENYFYHERYFTSRRTLIKTHDNLKLQNCTAKTLTIFLRVFVVTLYLGSYTVRTTKLWDRIRHSAINSNKYNFEVCFVSK